ncbi:MULTISPECIES: hypothetical protein [unclassified Acinetobacter]|uniref:hypothetical protein n=1 Tax=unclassified Acinetobacter TaxID=196816 RepID=UPI0015D36C64|nr:MULTISPECIES: hypothetical protein [unclassified Acinetobacter]
MNKFVVVLESDYPPQLYLGEKIGGATIIEMKQEDIKNRVTTAWLSERFNLSRKTIIEKVGMFNKGDENKHLYDPKEVLPILENLNALSRKRNSRRKN